MAFEFIATPQPSATDSETGVSIGIARGFHDDGDEHFTYKDGEIEFEFSAKIEGNPAAQVAYVWVDDIEYQIGLKMSGFFRGPKEPLQQIAIKYREKALQIVKKTLPGSHTFPEIYVVLRSLSRTVAPDVKDRVMNVIKEGVAALYLKWGLIQVSPNFRVEFVSRGDLDKSKRSQPN